MFDEKSLNGIEDLAPIGEEIPEDELSLAAGGMPRQTVIEIRSYEENKPPDLDIYIING